MNPQGFGNFLHRVNTRAHGLLNPEVEIQTSPGRGVVVPEALEVFFEQIGTNGLQVVAAQKINSLHTFLNLALCITVAHVQRHWILLGLAFPLFPLTTKSPAGKFGASTTTGCFETQTSPA